MPKIKKGILLGCILLCVLLVFTGCERKYNFTFSYDLEIREYTRGSKVELSATITNDSGFTYYY